MQTKIKMFLIMIGQKLIGVFTISIFASSFGCISLQGNIFDWKIDYTSRKHLRMKPTPDLHLIVKMGEVRGGYKSNNTFINF